MGLMKDVNSYSPQPLYAATCVDVCMGDYGSPDEISLDLKIGPRCDPVYPCEGVEEAKAPRRGDSPMERGWPCWGHRPTGSRSEPGRESILL